MAEAAAGEKRLPMEEEVREVLPSPAQPLSGALPVLSGSAGVFINRTPPNPPCAQFGAWVCLLQEQQEEEGAAAPSVSGVYFTCPLTGAVVRKDQKEKQLREAIQAVSASLQTLYFPSLPSPNPFCVPWLPSSSDLTNPPVKPSPG